MDATFYFSFHEPNCPEDEEPLERHLGFYVTNLRPWDEIEDDIEQFEEQIKRKYGMDGLLISYGTVVNAFGYESYEVEVDQQDELMEQWRKDFLRMSPECVVSDVFALTIDQIMMPSAHILQHAKDEHEQQQAQKLHDTLTTHVSVSPSAARKKI